MRNVLKPIKRPARPEIEAILARYPQQDGYLLTLFRTFANSQRFLEKAVPNLLDKASPLSIREREIVILRTTANRDCEYEWGVHVAIFAKAAKFSPAQVRDLGSGDCHTENWNEAEQLLIRCVDQLCAVGTINDTELQEMQQCWSLDQQLEILALCGAYHTISFVANTARLANESFGATFPAPAA